MYGFAYWAWQMFKIPLVCGAHSPELENPVPDCILVKGVCGGNGVGDVEFFPIGYFLWRTLHPGHFQTCDSTHIASSNTIILCTFTF